MVLAAGIPLLLRLAAPAAIPWLKKEAPKALAWGSATALAGIGIRALMEPQKTKKKKTKKKKTKKRKR